MVTHVAVKEAGLTGGHRLYRPYQSQFREQDTG